MRAVKHSQITEYILKNLSDRQVNRLIKELIGYDFIIKNGYYKNEVYYTITNKGINYLKQYGVIDIGKSTSVFYPEEFLTAYNLKINDRLISHQLALNEFVFKFEKKFFAYDFAYYDEKFVYTVIDNIRPDGVIFFNDTFYFLEQDMNTERSNQLDKKWQRYRKFLGSNSFENFPYPIKVLFILGGNLGDNSGKKYALLENMYLNLGDIASDRFNIFIDTDDNLLKLIEEQRAGGTPKRITDFESIGFTLKRLNLFGERNYLYITEKDRIKTCGTVKMEFLLEDLSTSNLYAYSQLKTYPKTSALIKMEKKRDINLLIMVNSMDELIKLWKVHKGTTPDIYFCFKDKKPLLSENFFTLSDHAIYGYTEGCISKKKIETGF
jgi:hypothetical protein